ncbi:MAG: DUF6020 family protein [Solobacterium sp.]|nr:DUF6020 family protein [Solobacterium sp.]MCI6878663.1 DUF6020 family protein [Solobacterium sp.]MDY4493926.1 DUF6020 family protein [Erysipelotrichaceae bacterium]
MKERNKKLLLTAIEAILLYYWCIFLVKADSYYSPYFVLAIIAVIHRTVCISKNIKPSKQNKILLTIFSVVLSLTVVLANYSLFHAIVSHAYRLIAIIEVFLGGFVVFRECIIALSEFNIKNSEVILRNKNLFFLSLWLIIIFVDLFIFYTAQYPGIFTPDSIGQVRQILTGVYTNHHPFYHTMIIKIFIDIGLNVFNDINVGVALYSIFSIFVLATCIIYIVKTIYTITKNLNLTLIVYICYLVYPVNIKYSFYMGKDVFFGVAISVFVVTIYKILNNIGNYKVNLLITFLSSLGVCLLRSNGLFVYVFSFIVFFILFFKKYKFINLIMVITILLSIILKYPVLSSLNVKQPDTIESLSIPAQQIARVIKDEKELTSDQKELLNKVIDIDKIPDYYVSFFSDPIKNLVREKGNQDYLKEHSKEYLNLYIQLGLKYPQKYIEAWVDQTRGYWNSGYAFWRWADGVTNNDLGVYQTINNKFFDSALTLYLMEWSGSPIFTFFLSIGFMVWLLIMFVYKSALYKRKDLFFIMVPPLLVIATLLIATPLYAEFRYAYAVSLTLPFIIAMSICDIKKG